MAGPASQAHGSVAVRRIRGADTWASPTLRAVRRARDFAAVVTDLDGTLLGTDGLVSPATVAAVELLADRGIPLVIATARSIHGVRNVVRELGATGHVVCSNGAVVWDATVDEIVEEQCMSLELVREVVDQVLSEIPDIGFAIYSAEQWHGDALFASLRPLGSAGGTIVTTPAEVEHAEVHLVTFRHAGVTHDELAARVRGCLPDDFACYAFTGGVDVALAGVTKATAVAGVMADTGIGPTAVVAFGDMPNDLPVLEWAGWACAVANAHPDVIAAADEVVARNDDDGVARWIDATFT